MKLAYLLSQYPTIPHTYLLREIRGLKSLGWEILTVSIKSPDRPRHELLPVEREEAGRTFYVQESGAAVWLRDHFATLFSRPAHWLRGFLYAIRLGGADLSRIARNLFYFAEAVTAGRWMLKNGVSHFHSHYSTTVGLLITRVFPLTMSMTVHGSGEFVDPIGFYLPQKIAASSFACAISCYGRSQMQQLVPYALWNRFEVTPLGIDLSEYGAAPFRMNPDPFEISSVGRLTAAKAHHVLLNSLHQLVSEGRNVRLRLVGDGPERASIEQRVDELGLRNHVILEGVKDQTEVRRLYERADCFALSSSSEGVPVALMEAMAMGIPSVATRITGVPELIRDGIDGLLVTTSDADELTAALARLMDDPALRRRLSESGRARVADKYNLSKNVRTLSDVFTRRLCPERAAPHNHESARSVSR